MRPDNADVSSIDVGCDEEAPYRVCLGVYHVFYYCKSFGGIRAVPILTG